MSVEEVLDEYLDDLLSVLVVELVLLLVHLPEYEHEEGEHLVVELLVEDPEDDLVVPEGEVLDQVEYLEAEVVDVLLQADHVQDAEEEVGVDLQQFLLEVQRILHLLLVDVLLQVGVEELEELQDTVLVQEDLLQLLVLYIESALLYLQVVLLRLCIGDQQYLDYIDGF